MSASLLYLVRHAQVALRSGVATRDWQLSAEGERAAHHLARAFDWKSLALVASSPEPKAIATARPIAATTSLAFRIEPDLREVDRGATPLVTAAEYEALVAAHFASPAEHVAGWERASDSTARICACIDRLVAESAGPVCVVSHGLVLSHYLAHLRGMPAPELAEWRAIPQPAIAIVDVATRRLIRPFE